MNEADAKILAEEIALKLPVDVGLTSQEKLVDYYAHSMVWFEENNVKPSVENFRKHMRNIAKYVESKYPNMVQPKKTNVNKPTGNRFNSVSFGKVIIFAFLVMLIYVFVKK